MKQEKATLLFQITGMKRKQEAWWRRAEKVWRCRKQQRQEPGIDPYSFSLASVNDATKLFSSLCFLTKVLFLFRHRFTSFWSDLRSLLEVPETWCTVSATSMSDTSSPSCFSVPSQLTMFWNFLGGLRWMRVPRCHESELALMLCLKGTLVLQDWGFLSSCCSAVLPVPGHHCLSGHKSTGNKEMWHLLFSSHHVPVM